MSTVGPEASLVCASGPSLRRSLTTRMASGIVKDDLMVRVGKDGHVAALARGAEEMDFTGRPMRGIVTSRKAGGRRVGTRRLGRDRRGVRAVRTPKASKNT